MRRGVVFAIGSCILGWVKEKEFLYQRETLYEYM